MARAGARGPAWFARVAAPVTGLVVLGLARSHRAAIADTLRAVRPSRGPVGDALDVARTFVTYATCVAEVLRGPDRGQPPQATVRGDEHLAAALAAGRGVVLVTAHTAGWEMAGRLLLADRGVRVVIVEQAEHDPVAREIQDEARREQGVEVAHAGGDPYATLSLLGHLRRGGVVALQVDRAVSGMRARTVRLFDRPWALPEGPLRLGAVAGAPVLPAFVARLGPGRFSIDVQPPIRLAPRPTGAELDAAARTVAAALEAFVRSHPTQWFNFTRAPALGLHGP